jgi:hypothetical protein
MAVTRKTLDFLPSIFQSDTNRKFLGSTLDQLVSEPDLQSLSGYIGRQFSPTNRGDNGEYILEPTAERQNYQLEPSLVIRDNSGDVTTYGNYVDFVNKIGYYGGITDNHDRLFNSEYYTYEPHVDLDKLVNYSQYYWLPNGPDAVTIGGGALSSASAYTFTSNANASVYTTAQTNTTTNPTITLVRGGVYTFTVNHPSEFFWIQTEPGISGVQQHNPGQTSRLSDASGVGNNGANVGVVTFTVPAVTAQDFYLDMPLADYTDFVTANTFTSIDGMQWTPSTQFDGDSSFPKDRYIVFTNTSTNNADWTNRFGQTVAIGQRRGLWKMDFSANARINLTYVRNIDTATRIQVRQGTRRGIEYYKNSVGNLVEVPLITAPLDTLYYQNSARPGQYGIIRLVDNVASVIDVETAIGGNVTLGTVGPANYTSPNGITLTNGMKITFDDSVTPVQYRNRTYIVEGVGTSIKLVDFDILQAPESVNAESSVPFDQFGYDVTVYDAGQLGALEPEYIVINRASQDQNAWSRVNRWFHVETIQKTAQYRGQVPNLDKIPRALRPIIEYKPNRQLFDMGRVGIGLVDEFIEPGRYIDGVPVLNLSDINNKRFIDLARNRIVLRKGFVVAGSYSLDAAVRRSLYRVDYLDQTNAIVFDGTCTGTLLGTQGTAVVNGTGTRFLTELSIGADLYRADNTYIGRVFSITSDTNVVLEQALSASLNNIAGVRFNHARTNLVVTQTAQTFSSIAVKFGVNRSKTYYLDSNVNWRPAQTKTRANQYPRFDIIDSSLNSFATAYTNSTFAGCSLFSYSTGMTTADPVLGQSLRYQSLGTSIGDIMFDNNFQTDTFQYTGSDISIKLTGLVNRGYVRINNGYSAYNLANDWNTIAETSKQYQHVSGIYDGVTNYFETGILPTTDLNPANAEPYLRVYINNTLLPKSKSVGAATPLTTTVVAGNAAELATLVNSYYVTYLSRYAEQQGLDFWVRALVAGAANSDVERAIRYSSEAYGLRAALEARIGSTRPEASNTDPIAPAIASQVHDSYLTFLGRWADQAGLDFWVNSILSGISTLADVDNTVKNSAEGISYRGRFNSNYNYEEVGVRKCVRINYEILTVGDRVDIFVYSAKQSQFGYYQVPANLEYNPENLPIKEISFGQMVGHMRRVGENVRGIVGDPLGTSNLRDIDLTPVAGLIQQQSSPVNWAMAFMLDRRINFVDSIDFARREYTRFKNKFLETAVNSVINPDDIPGSVDLILSTINSVKNNQSPWYYSDMLSLGRNYTVTRYTVLSTVIKTYNCTKSYGTLVLGGGTVNVYLNNVLAVRDVDVRFNTAPTFTFADSVTLNSGDIIEIREYANTDGSFIPETPTKLGLYPKFRPERYLDTTLRTPAYVIQGHDGSLTPAFNDYRDNLLLELEKRIYNNLKVEYQPYIFDLAQNTPGKFRTTDYSLAEYNQVLGSEFLKWAGTNQINFSQNNYYLGNDSFTWNYSLTRNQEGTQLPGYWRGIYRWYYDTDRPHTHPWEIIGYSVKPLWWDTWYSWTDSTKRAALILAITNGYIDEPGGTPVSTLKYARPGFSSVVPVNTAGNLISPFDLIVKQYNTTQFDAAFDIGDHGPVETAWRRSSEWPFALQKIMAVLKPAQYFARSIDTARYYRRADLKQFIYNDGTNQRLSPRSLVLNGELVNNTVTRATGYINWIHGYLTSLGLDAISYLRHHVDNMSVMLSYRVAGFTDARYLTVYAEQSTPTSVNQRVSIPDENYHIMINRGVPVARVTYSAVIVERSASGYTVSGYDTRFPYFVTIPSETAGAASNFEVLGTEVVVFQEGRDELLSIPYGTEFANRQQVVDFLVSYQRWLKIQGFEFDQYDSDLGLVRDWTLSAREFVTWSLQGWREGNILVLTPLADRIIFNNTFAVVDDITGRSNESQLIGANFNLIKPSEFVILRDGSRNTIYTTSGQSIAFCDLNLIQFESVILFDNQTVFGDIIYRPELGNRQYRLRLDGYRTAAWDGQLTPAGFVYNNDQVSSWLPGVDYSKGSLVEHKFKTYVALENVIAANVFDQNLWKRVDSEIKTGLLPNFSALASRSQNIYDLDRAPIDETFAAYSGALIGFRNRNYLEAIGITPRTQAKFYQGYITQKGTKNSIQAVARADYTNDNAIEIFEEWGARVGEYGAIDSNPYINLVITDSVFDQNPVSYEFVNNTTLASDYAVTAIDPTQLLSHPTDYDSILFLNRNQPEIRTFKIELYGDDIISGRDYAASLAISPFFRVCSNVQQWTAGRVTNTPDKLLYTALQGEFDLGITVRSVGSSTSEMLLLGNDGRNAPWPDDIEADIVVIAHGHADIYQGISRSVWRSRLRSLRNRVPNDKVVVWVTPTRINVDIEATKLPATGEHPLIGLYAYDVRSICAEYGDVLADAYAIENWTAYLGADGRIPNQQGYTVYTNDVLAPAIRTALRKIVKRNYQDYEDDLITAGYVNVDDVDYQLFDINQYANIDSTVIESLYTGFNLWCAKDFRNDWQVYRAYITDVLVIECIADLDNKIVFTTDTAHGLTTGDMFAVRYFDSLVDGFYQVLETTNTTLTVLAKDSVFQTVSKSGTTLVSLTGELIDFQPMRFADKVQRKIADPKHGWLIGDITWVDDDGSIGGGWTVDQYVNIVGTPAVPTLDVGTNSANIAIRNQWGTLTNDIYFDYLGRYADIDGLNFWVGLLYAGTATLTDVENAIKNSDEANNPLYWQQIRKADLRVDINSVNNLYLFSLSDRRILTRLDLLDPNKGRILGPALADIDFTTSIDPAKYRNGSETTLDTPISAEFYWGANQVGTYWWNMDRARFVDYEQDSLTYRLNNWSKLFPGSSVEVYEWIASDYLPSEYVANNQLGTPYLTDDSAYSTEAFVDPTTNTIKVKYYYWVRGHNTKTNVAKSNTTLVIENMIRFPEQQNIPYMVALRNNAIALYNIGRYLKGNDTVLYVSSQRQLNENVIHSEFKLIQEGNPASQLPTRIENKIIDSLIGADLVENPVPDTTLNEIERVGLGIRPRQTVIVDRITARINVINFVNNILARYPITPRVINQELVYSDNLFAEEPEPTVYTTRVNTYADMAALVPVLNANILVRSDETQGNYWSMYRVVPSGIMVTTTVAGATAAGYATQVHALYVELLGRYADQSGLDFWVSALVNSQLDINALRTIILNSEERAQNRLAAINKLVRRQTFDVSKYWYYQDWYETGYSAATLPTYVVNQASDVEKLRLREGDTVKILNTNLNLTGLVNTYNSVRLAPGSFELYRFDQVDGKLVRRLIGLQNGTIQISNVFSGTEGFDDVNFDLDLFDRNLYKEFRYILAALKQDIFVDDLAIHYNELMFYLIDFILSEQRYIDWFFKTSMITVKHSFDGLKQTAAFIRDRQQYYEQYIREVKPYRTKIRDYVLNYTEVEQPKLAVTDFDIPAYYDFRLRRFRSPNGDQFENDAALLTTAPYQDWNLNHKYSIGSFEVAAAGYGYVDDPDIAVVRQDNEIGITAQAQVELNEYNRGISKIRVTTVGSSYTQTPVVTVEGNGGTYYSDTQEYGFYVVSRGQNYAGAETATSGLYTSSNAIVANSSTIGYTMHRIRRSDGALVFTRQYNIVNQANVNYTGYTTLNLAQDLNATTKDFIVVVYGNADPTTNRLTNGLDIAMYRCGASAELFGSATTFKANAAYILVGIPGCGQRRGIEHYAGPANDSASAWCRIDFKLRRGHLVPLLRNPARFGLAQAYSLPDPAPSGASYNYGSLSYVKSGNLWINQYPVLTSLPGDIEPRRALVVPKMRNETIRKLRTVIRFDRVSYKSQVVDYAAGGYDSSQYSGSVFSGTYTAGTYVSYLGDAYKMLQNTPAAAKLNLGNALLVGSDQPVSSRNYLDGFFDNANDRIMAYYQPTSDMVPKILGRLVPGIDPAQSISANLTVGPDTILLGDIFSNNTGISPSNITVSGGSFIDAIFSHSPEELLPGQTFDTLSITVSNVSGVATSGYRKFVDSTGNIQYTEFTAAHVTTLARDLNLTDANILVTDGSLLASPVPVWQGAVLAYIEPGVISVNGERIAYYQKNGNNLEQIRRGYQITGTALVHVANSNVHNISGTVSIGTMQT